MSDRRADRLERRTIAAPAARAADILVCIAGGSDICVGCDATAANGVGTGPGSFL